MGDSPKESVRSLPISQEEALIKRRDMGLTQTDIAEAIGTSRNTYSLWERGERDLPPGSHIALANILRAFRGKAKESPAAQPTSTSTLAITLDPAAADENIALALQRAMVKEFGDARALGLTKMAVMLHECDFAHLYSAALRHANPEAKP